MRWPIAAVLFAAMLVAASPALGQAPFAPEPTGLWPGPMQGATPNSLKGATVIDDASALQDIVRSRSPVLLDVANLESRPAGVSAKMWTPIHRSIPDAIWLPGAGTGHDAPGFADTFAKRIEAATGGDKDKPIVTFCHAQRWGSWNAAKRLTDLGYRHVYWYPGGSEGWGAQASMKALGEDPDWKAGGFDRNSAGDMPDRAPIPVR